MAIINPYLNFNGQTEEAFNFYKKVFGGEFAMLMRFGDVPPGTPTGDDDKKKIMHVSLPISKETALMGSDTPDSFGKITQGQNIHLSVSASTEDEAKRIFKELSTGGTVTMPQEKSFWGALFGMCVDKFGISWMVSYDYNAR